MEWLKRTFDHVASAEEYPASLEAMRRTPLLVADLLGHAREPLLRLKPGGKWSLAEHAGHLLTMESLWIARLDDLVLGRPVLRPWNGTNDDTEAGRFNEQNALRVARDFQQIRTSLTDMMESLAPRCTELAALHERTGRKMTLSDHAWFIAEHDRHHLDAMQRLLHPSRK